MLVCLALMSGIAYGRYIIWRADVRPPVSLQLALALAEAELESKDVEYFCIGATLAQTFSRGDWELRFGSKEGKEMWVSVGSDRELRVSEEAFDH